MSERFQYNVPNKHADDDLIIYETQKRRKVWKKILLAVLLVIWVALLVGCKEHRNRPKQVADTATQQHG